MADEAVGGAGEEPRRTGIRGTRQLLVPSAKPPPLKHPRLAGEDEQQAPPTGATGSGGSFVKANSLALPAGAPPVPSIGDQREAPSPNPDGTGPSMDHHTMGTDVQELVRLELDKHPKEAIKHFQKTAVELAQKIQQLQRSIDRDNTVVKDLEPLLSEKVPKGMKGPSVTFECVQLDTMVLDDDLTMRVTIPRGVTFREAKKQLWFTYQTKIKELDISIIQDQKSELQAFCKKSQFVSRCFSFQPTADRALSILGIPDDDHDLVSLSSDKLQVKAEIIYQKTVAREAEAKVQRNKIAEDREIKKEKVVETLLQKKPSDWLDSAIARTTAEYFSKKGKGKGRGKTKTTDGFPSGAWHAEMFLQVQQGVVPNPDAVRSAIDAAEEAAKLPMPKNGKTPPAAGGKSKGQGKGKAGGKGKGKNPGKGTDSDNSGKRKGKGKAKGKGKEIGKVKNKQKNQQDGKGGGKDTKSGTTKGKGRGRGRGRA